MSNVWLQLGTVLILTVGILSGASYMVPSIRKRLYADDVTDVSRLSDDFEALKEAHRHEIDTLKAAHAKEIETLTIRLEYETSQRNQLTLQFAAAHREIETLKKSMTELQKINVALQAQIGDRDTARVAVLGIWSGNDLNLIAERDAIYDAGFEYRSLKGAEATRANILRELRTGKYAIIEVGSHGDADALFVNQQQLTAGWWQRALTNRGVRVAVVLACFSDSSVSDAMKRAGVQHVIGVSGEIEDTAAIEFAEQFYQLFAAGMPVDQAFDEAKLALDLEQGQKLTLR